MKRFNLLWTVCCLWLAVILGCSTSNPPSNNRQSSVAPISVPSPQVAEVQPIGWKPLEACEYLSNISGLQTRGYKNLYENTYGCSSPYKGLGVGVPLANNIAYYVKGDEENAIELKLVLNVNAVQEAKEAQAALLSHSEELTKKALGASMSEEVRNALTSGKAG